MLETTRGIFLHYLNYSDTSLIAKIYTEKYGIQSYMVNRPKSKKSGIKMNLLQPLFLLDLEAYHKEGKNIQRLKDVKVSVPFENLPYDIKRSSQAFFITDLLQHCLREEEPNPDLFNFIYHASSLLDIKNEGIANFTISFMFKLCRYLGIAPKKPESENFRFFDLISASFKWDEPSHNQFMKVETTRNFFDFFQYELTEIEKLDFTNTQRNDLLNKILEYYRIHLEISGELKSLIVLKEVFNS